MSNKIKAVSAAVTDGKNRWGINRLKDRKRGGVWSNVLSRKCEFVLTRYSIFQFVPLKWAEIKWHSSPSMLLDLCFSCILSFSFSFCLFCLFASLSFPSLSLWSPPQLKHWNTETCRFPPVRPCTLAVYIWLLIRFDFPLGSSSVFLWCLMSYVAFFLLSLFPSLFLASSRSPCLYLVLVFLFLMLSVKRVYYEYSASILLYTATE